MTDIHIHIIPNADDGSPSDDISLQMARSAASDGVSVAYCTPHMQAGPDAEEALAQISGSMDRLQALISEAGIPLRLLPGAEWMLSPELPDLLASCGRLGGSRAFLFEISPYMTPTMAAPFVRETVGPGLVPVLAHPERHPSVTPDGVRRLLGPLAESGAVFQLTAGSLTGGMGPKARGNARSIAETFPDGIVIASDAHDATARAPGLSEGYSALDQIAHGLAGKASSLLNLILTP